MQNDQLSPKPNQNSTKCYSSLPLKKGCTKVLIKFCANSPHFTHFKPCFSLLFFSQHHLGNFFKSSK